MFVYKYNNGLLPTTFNMFRLNSICSQLQLHVSMATLEIRQLELFQHKSNIIICSVINCKCIFNKFISHNDVNT